MKLGFGLYLHQLNDEHYRFARQCGATHLVIHLTDYFRSSRSNRPNDQPVGDDFGWGLAGNPNKLWDLDEILAIKNGAEKHGLKIEAIENFDPAHWYDILLDGPQKNRQFENLKSIIRIVGRAGIPIMGYNFSIAGVAGRVKGPWGRGEADVVAVKGSYDKPIPNGMVWNMVYNGNASEGHLPKISSEELWRRLGDFLDVLIPVAEEAGVMLAAHPDDPPMPTVREQPRLVYQPHLYQKVIDRKPSPNNALEFCLGSIAEMTEGNVYEAVEQYSRQNKIAYVHFRNVRGKVPYYEETFIDEGDIDLMRVIRILKRNNFDGVLIPDHAPGMSCAAPWHSGMAYACGWMKAALSGIQ